MSKIADFEKKLIKDGMTEQDFEQYCKMLKRVHDNYNKCQHCYTTAVQFPARNADQAIRLIEYGLTNFADSWSMAYTCHLFMGRIYHSMKEYEKAQDSYHKAMEQLGSEEFYQEYKKELCGELAWSLMHGSDFQYSDTLKEYYHAYHSLSIFVNGSLNGEFRLTLARLVIALYEENYEEAKAAYKQARRICKPFYRSKLYGIYAKHGIAEKLDASPEVMKYLRKASFTLMRKSV